MCTEAVVIYVKMIPRNSPEDNEENHENLSQDNKQYTQYQNRVPPE